MARSYGCVFSFCGYFQATPPEETPEEGKESTESGSAAGTGVHASQEFTHADRDVAHDVVREKDEKDYRDGKLAKGAGQEDDRGKMLGVQSQGQQ